MDSLSEFRNSVLEDVHINADLNRTAPREEFLSIYANALTDAEEFEDFEQLPFEGVGSQNKRILIDGYCYNKLDNYLVIVTCPFTDSLQAQTLTAKEADIHFKRARAFVEESLSGFIQKHAEESSPGYGLAININGIYKNVSKYKFYLLTDMIKSNRIHELPNTNIGNAIAEYHIWDISRFQALEASKTGKEDIIIDLTKFTEHGLPCLEAGTNGEYTAYLCSMPGAVLANLYNAYGSRLLEGNVRSFLTAKGKINKGIRDTILNEPEMFFAYNNGIAATAYNVKVKKGNQSTLITEITSLQIVNGGQTTASLAAAIKKDKDRVNGLKDIYVPMKLSIVTPEKSSELIPSIAKYANKQNKVSDADFFSNHAFHVKMEEYSRRILAPAVFGNQYGTHWYYERARGQYKQEQANLTKAEKEKFLLQNPKNQMFTKTDLARFYNIYRQIPHQVCLGAQKNFNIFAGWAGNEWSKNQSFFDDKFFKRIVCLDILYKKTDQIVKDAHWYEMGYKAQVATYTLSYLFHRIGQIRPRRGLDFKSIWNRQLLSHETEILLDKIAEAMYNHLISDSREVENVTEWAKREACWKKAKDIDIPLTAQFLEELVDMDERGQESDDSQQNVTSSTISQVQEYGSENWEAVLDWGIENSILTPQDISFLKIAISIEADEKPTEKQCAHILRILEKARADGYTS